MLFIIRTYKIKKYQHGAITITVSLLLLALSLMGAMYTVKSKLFDIRIANSEMRKNQAVISAEAGIQRGVAQLDVLPGTTASIVDEVVDDNQYSIDFIVMVDAVTGDNLGHPNWEGDRIVQIVSSGSSTDNTSEKIIEQKVWVHPITRSDPSSAITVSGGMGIGGAFTVGANPNGGGLGVPLSVWSDADVDLSGNGATCGLEEFDNEVCSSFPYSDKTIESSDVFEDTLVSAGGTFPDDVFEYTFGVATSDYQEIKDQADEIINDCSGLGASTTGLIWATADCTINANTEVGSVTDPVILIIEDADLKMNGGAIINGIVFSFSTTGSLGTGKISMTGSAFIRGAFISDHEIEISGGTFNTRFDSNVLGAISSLDNDNFTKVEMIPGSWKDF